MIHLARLDGHSIKNGGMMVKRKSTNVSRELSEHLSKLGQKGGKATARKLTKTQRVAKAKKAVAAREARRKYPYGAKKEGA
jgi:hypothetical protein